MDTTAPRSAGRPSLSGSGESPQIRFRVNGPLRQQLDELADATGQTVSEIARQALMEYLASQDEAEQDHINYQTSVMESLACDR